MTTEQLEKAKELENLIETTAHGLCQMRKFKESSKAKSGDGNNYEDGQFWLTISEHDDGSGISAHLNRYMGNKKIINMIINELTDQLQYFNEEFDKL